MRESQAGRRFWASHLKRAAIALFCVAALGVGIDRWMNSESDQTPVLTAAAISIAFYLALSLAMGLVNFVSGLLYLWAFGGKDIEDGALNDLRNARLPSPAKHQAKRFDYLVELADDAEVPADVRVRAAGLYAAYQVAIQRAGMFGGLAIAKGLDDATLRYAREAPEAG